MSRPEVGVGEPSVRSHVLLAVIAAVGLAWLTWPIWSSRTAASRDAATAEAPWLLAALLGMILILGWSITRDAAGRATTLGPIGAAIGADVIVRLVLLPRANGLEPVFALPMLLGMALGAPAGFLTGALACLGSTLAMGLVQPPLVGQIIVWGLWGAAGGLLRAVPRRLGIPLLAVGCIPLGVLAGLGLNLIGWVGDQTATIGGFLPGVSLTEGAGRLWEYTAATSRGYDLVRAATNAAVVGVLGLPILRAIDAVGAPPASIHVADTAPAVTDHALARRRRSAALADLWHRPTTATGRDVRPAPEGETE